MEIIQNIRGGQTLCYDGYMHTKKVSRNSYVLGECSERRGLKCKGTVTTDISIENVISKKEHSHSSDENKVQAAKVKSVMKDHATATRGKPSQIVADNVVNVPVNRHRTIFLSNQGVCHDQWCQTLQIDQAAPQLWPHLWLEIGESDSL